MVVEEEVVVVVVVEEEVVVVVVVEEEDNLVSPVASLSFAKRLSDILLWRELLMNSEVKKKKEKYILVYSRYFVFYF